ncbi:unnamed protein product [Vicia faba]|uniref:Glycine-rich protein n=1 Tax=Vicia faba TaxID=3906 RepID=A0AAV0YKB0_VICFA|nr:unnamed protein product [Vicia faba]
MDSRKSILILGLLAMVLLISSEVSARDLAETPTNAKEEVVEKSDEINDAKYYGGGYGGYHNGYGGYHNGYGNHGGYGYGHGGGYNGGGGGYGHGGGGYNGGGFDDRN